MTRPKHNGDASIRSVVAEGVANGLEDCRNDTGIIDKGCLHLKVETAIAGHPSIDRAITVQVRYSYVERLIGECLRGMKEALPTPPAVPSSAPAVLWDSEALRVVVQVPKGGGKYDAKRRMDLDMPEVDAMISYLDTLAASFGEDAGWYRGVKARWVQLGLPETATVREVLGL